jgi:hypothetical protein
MSHGRSVFIALVLTAALVPLVHAQTPVDVITNNGFENSGAALGFDAISGSRSWR